ncbi:hypothetical protein ACKFRM_11595 [Corynebacterium sp. YSMAA1_1_D6]|uniref:hypothetical protein n=1 Tax=Corynebacterium sp. YSMAA1_1_D6 TaxID=3383589 RepID=UPI0038D19B35
MTTVARRDPADKAKIDAIEKKLLANPEIAKLIDGECLMVCVWVPNLHEEMDQNDYCGTTRSG